MGGYAMRKLTVTVVDPETTTEVHTLQELFDKLVKYEPTVFVTIQFASTGEDYDAFISATLDE
jgi:hypothetical protein